MNKVKLLAHYIEMFLLSILILLFTLLVVLKYSLLNEDYVLNQFTNEHYQEVEEFLKKEMKNSMISSGIDSKVIDEMFSTDDIKNTTKETLDIIYKDNKKKLDVTKIEMKLRENIYNNLKEKNFESNDEVGLNFFVNSIIDIYKSEFIMLDNISSIGRIIIKLHFVVNYIIIILGMIIGVWLVIRIKKITKILPVPLFTSSLLILFGTHYISTKVGLSNFTIISIPFSKIIRALINCTFDIYKLVAIVFIIIAISLILLTKNEKLKTN